MDRDVVFVRADGSPKMGSGHLRRSSLVAAQVAASGVKIVLLCNHEAPLVFPDVHSIFDAVHLVATEADAIGVLKDQYADRGRAILFDGYGFDAQTHAAYRTYVPCIAAIDDLASRQMDVDLLIDVNLGRIADDYNGLVPQNAVLLIGPSYQIFQQRFVDLRAASLLRRNADQTVKCVFISIGGTDPTGLALSALETVLMLDRNLNVDVVTGSASPILETLRAAVDAAGSKVTLHIDASNVAELMAQADIAIGAGGTMTWERNCLGLPTLLLIIADNQQDVAHHMQAADAAVVLDARTCYPQLDASHAIKRLLNDPSHRVTLSKNAAQLSGGSGTHRIAKSLLQVSAS